METTTLTIRDILVFVAIAAVIIASLAAFLLATGVIGNYTICNVICGLKIEQSMLIGWMVPFGEACGC